MYAPPSVSPGEAPPAAQQRHVALVAATVGSALPPPKGQQWQQQPAPEIRNNSPWRRSACDRCRSQKLRCVRAKEDDTSRPCTRCMRIQYPCFTSSAKAPGRNSGKLPPAPESNASSGNPLGNTGQKATRRWPSEDPPLSLGLISPMSVGWTFNQDEDQHEEAGVFENGDVLMLTPSEENHPIDFFEFLLDKNSIGLASITSVPLNGHPCQASDSWLRSVPQGLAPPASASSPSGLHPFRELGDEHEGVVNMVDQDQNPIPSQTTALPAQYSPGVRLARLLESLSVELVRLHTEPWNLGVLSVTGSTTDSGKLDKTAAQTLTDEAPIFNPLLSILVSTGKFLDICKLLVAPESSVAVGSANHSKLKRQFSSPMRKYSESHHTQETAKRARRPRGLSSLPSSSSPKRPESYPSFPCLPGSPSSQSTITTGQLLMVVSCYLQVVTIYNDIFSDLLFQLAQPPPQLLSSTQLLVTTGSIPSDTNTPTSQVPSLVLAGYSVPLNAGLRMRLLVEVVEHQFEQIEHILGLPDQYCISTSHQQQGQQNKGTRGGILAGEDATRLLDTVMAMSVRIEGEGADAENAVDNSIGVVASLRENLGKAQRMRRGGG